MKITNRVISLALAIVLIISLAAPAFAADYYYPKYNGNSSSIVDALTIIGEKDVSFANRSAIAAINGITNYSGSASENLQLLNLLKQGKLKMANGQEGGATDYYYPKYNGNSSSIVDALTIIGEKDVSFANRSAIAAINGITNYSGSASENLQLLNLLKQGKLRRIETSAQSQSSGERLGNANPYVCYNYQQCTAGGNSIYEITKDNAPLREKASGEAKIITRLAAGQLLSVVQVVRNDKNNDWLRIEYINAQGKITSAYMYAGNCKAHVHTYTNALKNKNGTLKICTMCAYSIVTTEGKSVEKQLVSVLDQAVKGDYSKEDADFWGLVGRVLVGELPYVSVVADARDLFYDLTHNAHIGILALDALALVPVLGILKHSDGLYALKYANDIGNASEMVVKVGKYNLSDEVLNLFMFGKGGKGIKGKNVSGAHNMQNFMRVITDNGGDLGKCIDNTVKHPTVEGIYNITYRAGDSKALAKSPKTVYDPSVISDAQMFIWATEALSNAKVVDGTTDMIVGWASNGLKFEAKVDAAGNILHFYPQFD